MGHTSVLLMCVATICATPEADLLEIERQVLADRAAVKSGRVEYVSTLSTTGLDRRTDVVKKNVTINFDGRKIFYAEHVSADSASKAAGKNYVFCYDGEKYLGWLDKFANSVGGAAQYAKNNDENSLKGWVWVDPRKIGLIAVDSMTLRYFDIDSQIGRAVKNGVELKLSHNSAESAFRTERGMSGYSTFTRKDANSAWRLEKYGCRFPSEAGDVEQMIKCEYLQAGSPLPSKVDYERRESGKSVETETLDMKYSTSHSQGDILGFATAHLTPGTLVFDDASEKTGTFEWTGKELKSKNPLPQRRELPERIKASDRDRGWRSRVYLTLIFAGCVLSSVLLYRIMQKRRTVSG